MTQNNHDIEDVLSSIRRLVANDTGQVQSAVEAAQAARPVSEGPTLVLDPAQRVTEPEDPFQMIRSLEQEERDGRDAEHFTDAVSDDIADIARDLTEAMAEQETAAEIEAHTRQTTLDGTDREAEQDATTWTSEIETAAAVPDAYAEDTDYETVEDSGEPSDEAPQEEAIDMSEGFEEIARRAPDDEALRRLIVEIVRQELAGDLGERITRNVRKLVRREIRQTLASGEFD
ncbi:hypothetical protein MWU52_01685 [Jannaschia sp. S6380]|uniref:hypothetical protein n=1 Tax=Jannaschia sp. S6380 TaxID=2926408 RepID=UPI001FF5A54A|nr:hypothetical protein [Jannaschia sp. S6380]MCK0166254.1 hypothetical protein [Jannaschia sp. S6380]